MNITKLNKMVKQVCADNGMVVDYVIGDKVGQDRVYDKDKGMMNVGGRMIRKYKCYKGDLLSNEVKDKIVKEVWEGIKSLGGNVDLFEIKMYVGKKTRDWSMGIPERAVDVLRIEEVILK